MAILARSQSRAGTKVVWLAVHSTEGNGTAQDLRDATWWTGSAHAINDETGTLLTPAEGCIPYDRASWTLRNGNNASENIEQVGWAHWTREEWLSRPKLLDSTAHWLADRSQARGIPLVHLSPADVAAHKPGVLGHVDYTLGTGDGTHTDPGKGYPWDVVMAAATSYAAGKPPTPVEDDMYDQTARLELLGRIDINNYVLTEKLKRLPIVQAFQSDASLTVDGKTGTGEGALAGPGFWYVIPTAEHLAMYQAHGVCGSILPVSWNVYEHYRALFLTATAGEAVALLPEDAKRVADQVLADVKDFQDKIAAQVAALPGAVNDEADRRDRDADPATGAVS